jgi:hypothetical protein
MRLDLLRSTPDKDRTSRSSDYVTDSTYRGAIKNDDSIHNHFVFEDYRGDTPHARVSLNWVDVEAIQMRLPKRGTQAQRARKLAEALDGYVQNSN